MNYTNIPISLFPLLRKYVSFIYKIENYKNNFFYKTIPNGKIGFSFILSGHAEILRQNKWTGIPNQTIFGLIKKTEIIRLSKNFKEVAVGFTPENIQMFVSDSMKSFSSGSTIDIVDVCNPFELEKLSESMKNSITNYHILEALNTFLLSHLNITKENILLNTLIKLIDENNYYRVNEISKETMVSSATIRNMFSDYIGLSPKDYIKVSRIHKTLTHSVEKGQNLTELAYLYGFTDQSHMINEFKSILGLTPKQYFKNKNLVFDFYNFGRWNGHSFVE